MDTNEISLTPLKKASQSLEVALAQPKDEFTRDASIQRFEYTFELAWKILKRYLATSANIQEFNIKNLFREAGKQGLIDSVEAWFEYHQARNLTAHTYHEETAEETYTAATKFAVDVKKLITTLEDHINRAN